MATEFLQVDQTTKAVVTPLAQLATQGELLGLNGNAATAANATNMNSNGNVGSTNYSFNDVVKALKNQNILAR